MIYFQVAIPGDKFQLVANLSDSIPLPSLPCLRLFWYAESTHDSNDIKT